MGSAVVHISQILSALLKHSNNPWQLRSILSSIGRAFQAQTGQNQSYPILSSISEPFWHDPGQYLSLSLHSLQFFQQAAPHEASEQTFVDCHTEGIHVQGRSDRSLRVSLRSSKGEGSTWTTPPSCGSLRLSEIYDPY